MIDTTWKRKEIMILQAGAGQEVIEVTRDRGASAGTRRGAVGLGSDTRLMTTRSKHRRTATSTRMSRRRTRPS